MKCRSAASAVEDNSCSAKAEGTSSICAAIATPPIASFNCICQMTESLLGSIVIVLYEPQDPVNIAATIRAMKNMGVSRMRLVRPVEYEAVRLEGIAHGTMDLIDAIEHYDSFDAAVADC